MNFNIFGGFFWKKKYFWGMKILWIFRGHHKSGLYLGVIASILGSFLKVNVQNGGIFGVAKISNVFLGCLKFMEFLGVNGRCWARAYV